MPLGMINNVAGVYGLSATPEDIRTADMINNSGATRQVGDVVVSTDGVNVTTTTTLNDKTYYGVVAPEPQGSTGASAQTYAAGVVMPVLFEGIGRVNVGSNTPAAGDALTPSTVAGAAITNATALAANAVIGSIIGICLSATKDANNCVLTKVRNM